jgi:hypothetical protein
MNLLKFIFFSSLEYFSSFVFILIQFRFSLRENIKKIILISILLSFVSYSFINSNLDGISPLIQNMIFLIYIQVVLKVSFTNSIIMVVTGYIVFGLAQTCIIAVSLHMGLIALDELKAATNKAYLIQACSFLLMSVISFMTFYFKGGVNFIEARSRFSKKNLKGKNIWFIVFIFLAFLVTLSSNILLLVSKNPPYFMIASILFITLIVHISMTLKRDEIID